MSIYPYTLTLTSEEFDSLLWLAERYAGPETLCDLAAMTDLDDGGVELRLAEHEAWQVERVAESDSGDPYIVPCMGGTLLRKWVYFLDSIV